jgi:hypothetical protein
MSVKSGIYWPAFLIVATVSAAAVWRYAPAVPLPPEARAFCVKWTHKALQMTGLEEGSAKDEESKAVQLKNDAGQSTDDKLQTTADKQPVLKPETSAQKPKTQSQKLEAKDPRPKARNQKPAAINQKPEVRRQKPETRNQKPETKSAPAPRAAELRQAELAEDALAMTPAQRKVKYDELTKKAETRRKEIMRENLSKSPEGQKALAAVKEFKELAEKVEALKKKYGETDSRVVSKRGDILRLKDKVRRTNEAYKKWKEQHPDKFTPPEADEIYRKIIGERQLYSE